MRNTYISKTDLAVAYFPYIDVHSARHKLMGIINSDDRLLPLLIDTGYQNSNRQFSPRQVELILDRLGNPWK